MQINAPLTAIQAAQLLTTVAMVSILSACAPAIHSSAPYPAVPVHPEATYFPEGSGDFYFNVLAAQLSMHHRDWVGARNFYQKALLVAPESPYILLQLSRLAVVFGDHEGAEAYCRRALEHDPRFADARQFMARLLRSRDKNEAAITHYQKLLTERPGDEKTLLTLAAMYAEQKHYEKALSVIDELLQHNPDSEAAFFQRGNLHADQGHTDKAEAAYLQTIARAPDFLPARINLAGLYEAGEEFERAIEVYQTVADHMPDHQLVRAKLAYLHVKIGDLGTARSHYQYLLDSTPRFNEDIALKIGLIYFEQDNFTEAEVIFTRITEENPGNQRAQYYLGHTLEKTRKPEEAARAYRAVKPGSDFFTQARIQLAFILHERDKTHTAQQLIQETIAVHPDEPSLYHVSALLHAENSDYQAGITALHAALEHDSDAEHLLYYLGHLYHEADMFEESITTMRRVLEINSSNADALNFIGYLYAERGIQLREARRMIKKALAIKPDDGYIIDSLGWVYFQMGRYKRALTHLQRAHDLVPDDPVIAGHLGDAYHRMNKADKALELYYRVLDIDPDNDDAQQKIDAIMQGM